MRFKNHIVAGILLATITLADSRGARADLMITIPDVTVAPGGSGFLDVMVYSNAPDLTPDSFQNYSLDFSVSGLAQAGSPISFVESVSPLSPLLPPTPPPQVFELNYIFVDDSAEAVSPIGIDFVGDSAGAPVANDLISVMDGTDSFADRSIAMSDGVFLLARLNFMAPLDATPGSVYDVSLDFGEFADVVFQPSADFSYPASGSITISAAAAVPEPSSIALLALGSLAFFARKYGRRTCHSQ